jgi:hypothetical protein
MANRFWNPAGAANYNSTSAWALIDGGTPDQAAPTLSDDVFFTSTNNNNCDVNVLSEAKSISFTGGTGYSGTFSGTNTLNLYGDLTLSSATNFTFTNILSFRHTSGTAVLTTVGKQLTCSLFLTGIGGTTQLGDDFTTDEISSNAISIATGAKFDANSKTVTLNNSSSTQQNIAGPAGFTGSNSFYNLTRTGGASKTSNLRIGTNITCTGTFTVNGNSTI